MGDWFLRRHLRQTKFTSFPKFSDKFCVRFNMSNHQKDEIRSVSKDWIQVVDEETIGRLVSRLSYEIVERDRELKKLAIVGIRTAGEHLALRIRKKIEEIEKTKIQYGVIDITLYRDDLSTVGHQPLIKGTNLPFQVSGARIVLVDDVLFTGRTIRAALDAIIDFGRPQRVELAVLVDRGHKELPIRADFVGKNIPTNRKDHVKVKLQEMGFHDGVYVIKAK